MKIENWNGHDIRFVEREGEWWAVAVDIAKALDLGNTTKLVKRLDLEDKALTTIQGLNRGNEPVNIINEFGIYKAIMTSRKEEARQFERWVFRIIKELRQSSGLEGFQIFRMLDKEHQKEAMSRLRWGLKQPVRVDFIKANTITNKAISIKHGKPKMIKKADMTPEMLKDRESILDETVSLMTVNDRYNLNLSVSEQIYKTIQGSEKAG